jgi:hypothetical protein
MTIENQERPRVASSELKGWLMPHPHRRSLSDEALNARKALHPEAVHAVHLHERTAGEGQRDRPPREVRGSLMHQR